jgi:hypothetical protein
MNHKKMLLKPMVCSLHDATANRVNYLSEPFSPLSSNSIQFLRANPCATCCIQFFCANPSATLHTHLARLLVPDPQAALAAILTGQTAAFVECPIAEKQPCVVVVRHASIIGPLPGHSFWSFWSVTIEGLVIFMRSLLNLVHFFWEYNHNTIPWV